MGVWRCLGLFRRRLALCPPLLCCRPVCALVCFWEGFGLDLKSCGAVRAWRMDRWTVLLRGAGGWGSVVASVSDLCPTETQFHASGGLRRCPDSVACLWAEALSRSHLQCPWGACSLGRGRDQASWRLLSAGSWPVLPHPLPQFPNPPPPGQLPL